MSVLKIQILQILYEYCSRRRWIYTRAWWRMFEVRCFSSFFCSLSFHVIFLSGTLKFCYFWVRVWEVKYNMRDRIGKIISLQLVELTNQLKYRNLYQKHKHGNCISVMMFLSGLKCMIIKYILTIVHFKIYSV